MATYFPIVAVKAFEALHDFLMAQTIKNIKQVTYLEFYARIHASEV